MTRLFFKLYFKYLKKKTIDRVQTGFGLTYHFALLSFQIIDRKENEKGRNRGERGRRRGWRRGRPQVKGLGKTINKS